MTEHINYARHYDARDAMIDQKPGPVIVSHMEPDKAPAEKIVEEITKPAPIVPILGTVSIEPVKPKHAGWPKGKKRPKAAKASIPGNKPELPAETVPEADESQQVTIKVNMKQHRVIITPGAKVDGQLVFEW